MESQKQLFGILSDSQKVNLYTLKNKHMSFCVTDFGCTITSINVQNKKGELVNVVLGYSDLAGYIRGNSYFGCIVGRVANRIAQAEFTLNKKTYQLDKNDGNNFLHGGFNGYNKMVWNSKLIKTKEGTGVQFNRMSPSGEQGFDGNLQLEVTYMLTKKNEIILRYKAKTDKTTPVNLTNHTYFNLRGFGTVLDHELTLFSDSYAATDKKQIPTGKILSVQKTPFDFTKPKKIGEDIKKTNGGYDTCYCVKTSKKNPVEFARVSEKESGITMTASTNLPAFQFYSGNFLQNAEGRLGKMHNKYDGFCLETQYYPDSVNHAEFPSSFLHPNETYEAVTIYKFD